MKIKTLDELRSARQSLSEEVKATERCFADRTETALQFVSLGKMVLPLIKKLRSSLFGTPFARS